MKPEERDAAARQRTAFNAWFASVVAVFIYLLLPWLISAPRIPQGEPYRGFRVILWLVAMIQTGVLWWWMRRYLGKEAILKAVQRTAINPVVYYTAKDRRHRHGAVDCRLRSCFGVCRRILLGPVHNDHNKRSAAYGKLPVASVCRGTRTGERR